VQLRNELRPPVLINRVSESGATSALDRFVQPTSRGA
jgi:hypothetical protein